MRKRKPDPALARRAADALWRLAEEGEDLPDFLRCQANELARVLHTGRYCRGFFIIRN